MVKHFFILLALALLLVACDFSATEHNTPPVKTEYGQQALSKNDQNLLKALETLKLTGDPSSGRDLPSIHTPKAQLGKKLFFSNTLSPANLACASCHNPNHAGTNEESLATGLSQLQKPTEQPNYFFHRGITLLPARNAPTTFNIALWDRELFQDGRVENLGSDHNNGATGGITTPFVPYPTLDSQAGKQLPQAAAKQVLIQREPLVARLIAQQHLSQCAKSRLPHPYLAEQLSLQIPSSEETQWLPLFRNAFNAPNGLPQALLTEQNISEALAEYIRSQTFVQNNWKAYLEGNIGAIGDQAKAGALLFFGKATDGGFDCVSCHQGDKFSDESFHHTLTPPVSLQRPFRSAPEEADYGRWLVTMKEEDKFRFRTPSLLNVAETGPWGHNGAWRTLSETVRHMLNPWKEVSHYETANLAQYGLSADHLPESLAEMLRYNVDLPTQKHTEKDIEALVAFLNTLTDPCLQSEVCLKPWQSDPSSVTPNNAKP